jgi:chaperonin GroEL
MLKDIATLTGATIIDNEYGIKLEEVEYKHFGSAKKIVVDAEKTHIVGGEGRAEEISNRLDDILRQIN